MTEKQRLFCDEYLIDCNAAQAAIRAGYSAKYANTNAFKLLQNTAIKAYIEKRLEEMKSEKTADIVEVMEYLTSVMRGESKSEIVVVEGIGEGCSSAVHIDKAPDEKEKLKAAELLGKRYGLFTDKVQLESTVPIQIFDDIPKGDVDG